MRFLKISKLGMAVAGLYLLVAMAVFVAHIYSVKTNSADSGESGIPLFMLALPWMMFIPASLYYLPVWSWLAYPILWLCVAFNAFLVYCVVGLGASIIQWTWNRFIHGVHNR